MLVDLTRGQVCALQNFFNWGDSSVMEGHIDTEKNEVTLMGCDYPYTEKIPKGFALVEVNPDDKWKVIKSKNFWCREEKEK